MASDARDSHHRKHRRSPSDDEEADKSSKRHKHRHYRHRHHRHRSKNNEGETKSDADDVAPPSPPRPSVPVGNDVSRPDDDVEEGEILDEEPIKDDLGVQNPGDGEIPHPVEEHAAESTDKSSDKKHDQIGLPRNYGTERQEKPHSRIGLDSHANWDLGHDNHLGDQKWKEESRSPSRTRNKRKSYHGDVEDANEKTLSDTRKLLSSESSGERKGSAHSPVNERHDDSWSRSRSHDLGGDRSCSQSMMDEEALMKIRHRHDRDASYDRQRGSRDLVRDEERERSVSYSRQVIEDRRHSLESWGRESREGEMDRGWRRDKDRERSREREIHGEKRRVKERDRSRDRGTGTEMRRDKERDRSRDKEMDSDRGREKERGRSRDRDRKEKLRERSWDRELHMDTKREKERGRSRDRVRSSDRDRGRTREKNGDWNMDRERERRNDRNRNKGRDIEFENDSSYDDRDPKHLRRDETESYRDRTRKNCQAKVHGSNSDSLVGDGEKLKRDEEEQDDFEERVTLKLAEQEEEELNRIKEESRKRRQAILEKYKKNHVQQQNDSPPEDVKDNNPVNSHDQSDGAADAGRNVPDRGPDGLDGYVADPLLSVEKSPTQNGNTAVERTGGVAGLGEGTPKSERSGETFCDDIFGETPARVRKTGKGEGLRVIRSGLHDNWDDAEGYYSYRFGELLDGRYEVIAAHGKGVFSTVVRAKDLKASNGELDDVAIKIIRNNETMHKAGQLEVQILKKLAGADPDNRRHCVRFLSSFKYRNHLCLVFESLHMNLREVLKKFGRNIGLKLTAVRAYAKQLFIALKHLKNCGVLHCDIKPDNMLVNDAKNVLKLCDFGNAMFAGKNEITPYLVSRFYRAPEIILGLPYDHPMDIWSVGCCLYELYTGKVLFPGPTNNDMLRLHMELKGPFPKKMLRKGAFTDQHFDQDLNFHATEEDPVTKKTIKRMILNIKPKDMGSIITGSAGEDPKMLANFKDLLEKIFVLDPEKRMTVAQALTHPFITGK